MDVRLNTKILEVRPDRVVIGDGESLPSDLTVWAAGVAGPDALAAWGLPRGKGGRVLVLPDLRVEGSDRIFAIGDIALCEQDPAPQLAQPALQQGKHAAEQVVHLVRGEPTQPFRYHDTGHDGHHRPPLGRGRSCPSACGSPGRWPGWPGSACT